MHRGPIGAQLLRKQANAEKIFFKEVGISSKLLIDAIDYLEPICVATNPSRSTDDIDHYGVAWKWPGFVPSLAILKQYGVVDIEGYWPMSQFEVDNAVKKLLFRSEFKVRYIEYLPEPINTDRTPHALPQCKPR